MAEEVLGGVIKRLRQKGLPILDAFGMFRLKLGQAPSNSAWISSSPTRKVPAILLANSISHSSTRKRPSPCSPDTSHLARKTRSAQGERPQIKRAQPLIGTRVPNNDQAQAGTGPRGALAC